jgi:hypothetical protein
MATATDKNRNNKYSSADCDQNLPGQAAFEDSTFGPATFDRTLNLNQLEEKQKQQQLPAVMSLQNATANNNDDNKHSNNNNNNNTNQSGGFSMAVVARREVSSVSSHGGGVRNRSNSPRNSKHDSGQDDSGAEDSKRSRGKRSSVNNTLSSSTPQFEINQFVFPPEKIFIIKPFHPSKSVDWVKATLARSAIFGFSEDEVQSQYLQFIYRDICTFLLAQPYGFGGTFFVATRILVFDRFVAAPYVTALTSLVCSILDFIIHCCVPKAKSTKSTRFLNFYLNFLLIL